MSKPVVACANCGVHFETFPCRVSDRNYCSRKCFQARPLATFERFWSKVHRGGPNECWQWLGHVDRDGYGKFRLPTAWTRAHRLMFSLHHKIDPGPMFVCHTCDTPGCVNPSHLWLGTNKDNLRDASAKGRTCSGDAHWQRKTPERRLCGEKNYHSKLTEEDVLAIREMYGPGVRQVDLAATYDVSQETISRIVRRKGWRHI